MGLSIAINNPHRVLARGSHAGFEWVVLHNNSGYRCGYVRVPQGHPWHRKHYFDIAAEVHGGLTFAEPGLPCDRGQPDDGYWVGFDCAHDCDAPDPMLPRRYAGLEADWGGTIRTQEYVEAECRRLCEQAAEAINQESSA